VLVADKPGTADTTAAAGEPGDCAKLGRPKKQTNVTVPAQANALHRRPALEAVLYEVIGFIGNVPVKCLFAFAGSRFIGDQWSRQQASGLVCGKAIGLLGGIDRVRKFIPAPTWIQLLVRHLGKTLLARTLFHVVRVIQTGASWGCDCG
jgi:hypothetical protein